MGAKRADMRLVDVRTPTVCLRSQSDIKSFPNLLKLLGYTSFYFLGESYEEYMESLCKFFCRSNGFRMKSLQILEMVLVSPELLEPGPCSAVLASQIQPPVPSKTISKASLIARSRK